MVDGAKLGSRPYRRPYGLYGPVQTRTTRNTLSRPFGVIWCLCNNRAKVYGSSDHVQGPGLARVSKEHQEDAVCNGNLRELAHGSDWLMIVQDRLDIAVKK
ncbi:BnaCnng29830D [Brassica napus]|uniref:BnaCnng29830D protein n=1 Tax=Brassica napus TaxID=3708 RepID=A0A078J1Y7_BRANA|nr:BnaCnng29830D [Brassica napus]